MTQTTDSRMRWTTTDLQLLPESSNRYEIIDGELLVTRSPHWGHQKACGNAYAELRDWSVETSLGEAVQAPGVIFSDADNVIPDVVWISKARLATSLDESGHLTVAPELIVEVLSSGVDNERRDRETKLKLYTSRGVQDYWILDWRLKQIEVYRRQSGLLQLESTLFPGDTLSSPLLPSFACDVERLFL
ncbi:Uma2 family endonuclease [Leptolyngbya cf. ectocarpi LEGE 11479]|uniref:Uma2 family endonuclease n=1 Tax=Leptolyngbya cf. ectocarpi LEGE 11479 TaxID=1828722 RepID=A0A929F6A0_LEPEC|nr:Uma2 family endonuclease [Leptolyngbya ectocarpi]MBE9067536.1 Uma2 family endonuclease [Leptolyngbya cf. ectocarpi LEGE 11479]